VQAPALVLVAALAGALVVGGLARLLRSHRGGSGLRSAQVRSALGRSRCSARFRPAVCLASGLPHVLAWQPKRRRHGRVALRAARPTLQQRGNEQRCRQVWWRRATAAFGRREPAAEDAGGAPPMRSAIRALERELLGAAAPADAQQRPAAGRRPDERAGAAARPDAPDAPARSDAREPPGGEPAPSAAAALWPAQRASAAGASPPGQQAAPRTARVEGPADSGHDGRSAAREPEPRRPAPGRLGGGGGSIARYLGVTAPPGGAEHAEPTDPGSAARSAGGAAPRAAAHPGRADLSAEPGQAGDPARGGTGAPLRPRRLGRAQAGPARHPAAKPVAQQSPEFRRKAVISAYFAGGGAAAPGPDAAARALGAGAAAGPAGEQAEVYVIAGASVFGGYKAPSAARL